MATRIAQIGLAQPVQPCALEKAVAQAAAFSFEPLSGAVSAALSFDLLGNETDDEGAEVITIEVVA